LNSRKKKRNIFWKIAHPAGGGTPLVETFVPVYKQKLSDEERRQQERLSRTKPEDYIYAEHEQFTPDIEWMPNVVLIAKNIYVWLDQLSKKYQREIKRLDQIPDEELDQLARWSFTSLWLIGVWERSTASKRIKQITGNLDAVSSAYSLLIMKLPVILAVKNRISNSIIDVGKEEFDWREIWFQTIWVYSQSG